MKPQKSQWITILSALLRSGLAAIVVMVLGGTADNALAQAPSPGGTGTVVTLPASSVPTAGDTGLRAHTSLQVLTQFSLPGITAGAVFAKPLTVGPPFPGAFYQTPASLACIYGLEAPMAGCDPYAVYLNPNGGRNAIAVVDAYDDPNAYTDLQNFSGQFGVAGINPTSFITAFAPFGGSTPGSCVGAPTRPAPALGTGWEIEESLDVEYAHAMAPEATLYLVEAQSNSYADLFCAVSTASKLVAAAGGGEVSMSWGGQEFPLQIMADSVFTTPKVVYFAAAGDGPGVEYPSASPNVVSVGGTTLSTSARDGNFIAPENIWQQTGGGVSAYEPVPGYQSGIAIVTSTGHRGTPDIAADANPYTGVWVLDSLTFGYPVWFIVGGTSVAAPTWSGIVNTAGSFAPSSAAELTKLYSDSRADFNPVSQGSCGLYMQNVGIANWNFCTGLGSPKGYTGK